MSVQRSMIEEKPILPAEIGTLRDRIAARGFAVVAGVLDSGETSRLADALDAAAQDEQDGRARRRSGAVFGVRDLLSLDVVRDAAGGEPLIGLARAVLGDGARPVKAILFDKQPEANWRVEWHQDLTVALAEQRETAGFSNWTVKSGVVHAEAPDGVLAAMVTLRLHLDDCGADNGPVAVIPGSHADGKLSAAKRRRLTDSGDEVPCLAAPGDVLAMRPLILHRSPKAASPSRRRVLHIEYSAAPLPGGLRWAADSIA